VHALHGCCGGGGGRQGGGMLVMGEGDCVCDV